MLDKLISSTTYQVVMMRADSGANGSGVRRGSYEQHISRCAFLHIKWSLT